MATSGAQAYPAQVLLFFIFIARACIVALAVARHRRTLPRTPEEMDEPREHRPPPEQRETPIVGT